MYQTQGSIFINYRRDDSGWNTVALYNELQEYFSRDQIFKDFNAILPGDDFVESIHKALQDCDVLLVIIGKSWLNMKNAEGVRRLDEPDDFVRLEIAKALERKIKVIPVLFDNVRMPNEEELPPGLEGLARKQSVEILSTRFEDDVRNLAEAIKRILDEHPDNQYNTTNSNQEPERTFSNTSNLYGNTDKAPVNMFTGSNTGHVPKKPANNLVWGILTTIFCCLPLGIVSILQANKVDTLYSRGMYSEAADAANKAKKWAVYALVAGLSFWFIYVILIGIGVIHVPEAHTNAQ